jgi:hypothetical protein
VVGGVTSLVSFFLEECEIFTMGMDAHCLVGGF